MRAKRSKPLTLVLDYRVPSLNRVLKRHWAIVHREKRRVLLALGSAIARALCDRSTPTTWLARLNTAQTRLCAAVCFMGIRQSRSRSSGRRKRSLTLMRKSSLSQFQAAQTSQLKSEQRQPMKAPHNAETKERDK